MPKFKTCGHNGTTQTKSSNILKLNTNNTTRTRGRMRYICNLALLSILLSISHFGSGQSTDIKNAIDFLVHEGIRVENGENIVSFDSDDFITYGSINFGQSGTTKSIRLYYAKGNREGAKLEARLGGREGEIIGEYIPLRTQGWNSYKTTYFNIKDVEGIHDLTFVGKNGNGVMHLKWFELSKEGDNDVQWNPIIGTIKRNHNSRLNKN